MNDLVKQIARHFDARARKEKLAPSPEIARIYVDFIRSTLSHAFTEPHHYDHTAEAAHPILDLLSTHLHLLPDYPPGPFRTPIEPHITREWMQYAVFAFMHHPVKTIGLYKSLRAIINDNCTHGGKIMTPEYDDAWNCEKYLKQTPLIHLTRGSLSFSMLPYVNTHWCMFSNTGGGKTSFLAACILENLSRAEPYPQVIIDPHGDLASKLEQLAYWQKHPDRLLIVDPSAFPAINPLDLPDINQIASMYGYIFAAEGADMTGLQSVAFSYLVEALLEKHKAEGATFTDMLMLVDADPKTVQSGPYWPYIQKLDDTAQQYFLTRFFKGEHPRTGISQRLHILNRDKTFKRIFNARKNKLDLYDALHTKKQTVIVTAKGLNEGAATFLRFIIMSCMQVAFKRSRIPERDRHPIHLYVDEAQLVLQGNEEVKRILTECRKYALFIRSFTQQMSMLSKDVVDVLLGQTDVKITASPFLDDAEKLAKHMNCDVKTIYKPKPSTHLEYQLYVSGKTNKPLTLKLPFGYLDNQPKMEQSERIALGETLRRTLQDEPIAAHSEPEPDIPDEKPKSRKRY